jgi:3-oxoacyl-[acyl-carrier protein] reductase
MNSNQKVALVTGSATGIGRSVALRFAKEGYAIAVNYSRSKTEAEETATAARGHGVPAIICRCNVAEERAVKSMIARCRHELGGLDVLVNNAGTTRFIEHTNLDALTDEVWNQILSVNLMGTFYCCRAALEPLRQRGGAIVNVTSVAGLQGNGSSIPYAASKAAINCMTKSLARALAPAIRVNAVAPGPVLTRWLADHMELVERYIEGTPMRRAASSDDIADVVYFLSSGTTMVTGQVWIVDGGRTV